MSAHELVHRTAKDRLGSWACENVRPRETGDAKLNLACCHNCEPESTWLAGPP